MSQYTKSSLSGNNNLVEIDWTAMSGTINSALSSLTTLDVAPLTPLALKNEMENTQLREIEQNLLKLSAKLNETISILNS